MKVFSSTTQKIGALGEGIACRFLVKHGFTILERNFSFRGGEIDIIALRQGAVHLVEVKTIQSSAEHASHLYNPFQNISPEKLNRLSNTALLWITSHPKYKDSRWQLDGIGVSLNQLTKKAKVVLLENINIV